MISFGKLRAFGVVCALASLLVAFTGCTKTAESAGGVTDIGNSIAGVVVDASGNAVPSARVVAYYDNWNQSLASDSVVAIAGADGKYELKVDSNANVVLFASYGEDCGLAATKNVDNYVRNIHIGKRRTYSSRIAGRLSGEVRVVGATSDSAFSNLESDGSFTFHNMPQGDVTLAYSDSTDAENQVKSRIEFTTNGDRDSMALPELNLLEDDPSWLTVLDLRYYVGEGFGGVLIRNPVSEHWTPVTELPETDSIPSQVVTVAVPQNVEYLTGFLFPIKIETDVFPKDVNKSDIVVVNNDNWELFPSEIEYWNDEEALLWVRIAGVDSGVTELNFKVFESAEYAAKLISFDLGQKYDYVYSRLHFNGDASVRNSDGSAAKSVADSVGFLGKGVTLGQGQYMVIDSVDMTWGLFTMSLWTRWNGDNGKAQVLVSERGDSTYKFQWRYEDGKFSLMKGAPSSLEIAELGSYDLPVDEWTHLVLVYDNINSLWTMYVNGAALGETVKFSPSYTGSNMFPARLGGSGIEADTWNGALDEFRFESVIRTPKWIKSVYETQKTAAK